MSLRILAPSQAVPLASSGSQADGWASRLAKLIPAEALGLYGAGSSVIPAGRIEGLWILAVVCLIFSGALRFVATRDAAGKPQFISVGIAMISFILWLAALGAPAGPIDLGSYGYAGGLAALVWGTVVPALYKGD